MEAAAAPSRSEDDEGGEARGESAVAEEGARPSPKPINFASVTSCNQTNKTINFLFVSNRRFGRMVGKVRVQVGTVYTEKLRGGELDSDGCRGNASVIALRYCLSLGSGANRPKLGGTENKQYIALQELNN